MNIEHPDQIDRVSATAGTVALAAYPHGAALLSVADADPTEITHSVEALVDEGRANEVAGAFCTLANALIAFQARRLRRPRPKLTVVHGGDR